MPTTEDTLRRLMWLTGQEARLSTALGAMTDPPSSATPEERTLWTETRRTLADLSHRTSRQRVAVSGAVLAGLDAVARAAK